MSSVSRQIRLVNTLCIHSLLFTSASWSRVRVLRAQSTVYTQESKPLHYEIIHLSSFAPPARISLVRLLVVTVSFAPDSTSSNVVTTASSNKLATSYKKDSGIFNVYCWWLAKLLQWSKILVH